MAERCRRGPGVPTPDNAVRRDNLGFLLAKASQRWNELLYEKFVAAGFPEVRPSYGSILIPLYEEDGLRMGEVARRARLSKQTITTMVRLAERDGLVDRQPDPDDGRASRIFLTPKATALRSVASNALAELDQAVVSTLRRRHLDDLKSMLALLAELKAS